MDNLLRTLAHAGIKQPGRDSVSHCESVIWTAAQPFASPAQQGAAGCPQPLHIRCRLRLRHPGCCGMIGHCYAHPATGTNLPLGPSNVEHRLDFFTACDHQWWQAPYCRRRTRSSRRLGSGILALCGGDFSAGRSIGNDTRACGDRSRCAELGSFAPTRTGARTAMRALGSVVPPGLSPRFALGAMPPREHISRQSLRTRGVCQ